MAAYYLAVDIGASSGRHILGHMENGKMVLEEIYRFENGMIKKDGELCWEFDRLFKEVVNAGPGEATAIGNITAQMLKAEEFKTIEEARTIIHESFGVKVYK